MSGFSAISAPSAFHVRVGKQHLNAEVAEITENTVHHSSLMIHSFRFSPSSPNQAQVSRSQPSSKSLSWSATKFQAGIILGAADHLEIQVVLSLGRQLG